MAVARTKLLAVLLGPAGVGLLGIYHGIVATVASAAGLGLGTVGARFIASPDASGSGVGSANARAALRRLSAFLAVTGALGLVFFSGPVAQGTLGSLDNQRSVALLGLAVAPTILSASYTAYLTGLRRTEDLARVWLLSGLLGTLAAVGFVTTLGDRGILPLVLVAPLATLCVAAFYAGRVRRGSATPSSLWRSEAWAMVRLGFALTITGTTSALALLTVRSIVAQRLSLEASGLFSATWTISMTYVGFILSAMSVDYFPRLSAARHSRQELTRAANEQAEVALLLAIPVLVGMTALAPAVLSLLYSGQFDAAAPVLRWQMVGNIFKVASWPLSFVLLARGASGQYIVVELAWSSVFVGSVFSGLPWFGLTVVGPAYVIAYVVYFAVVVVVVRHSSGVALARGSWLLLGLGVSATVAVLSLRLIDESLASFAGASACVLLGIVSVRRLVSEPVARLDTDSPSDSERK